MRDRLLVLWIVVILAGCYSSYGVDDLADADGGTGLDGASEVVGDPVGDVSPEAHVDGVGDPHIDSMLDTTGVLVPEGPSTLFETESGEYITSESCFGSSCADFSGSIYEIVMQENTPWHEDSEFVGVYRLAPGGTLLGTSWIDDVADRSEHSTHICWTGEVFVVALSTTDMGMRILAVRESGELARPIEVLDVDERYQVLACPSTGPVLVDFGIGGLEVDRIHHLTSSGAVTGRYVDAYLPDEPVECTEAGSHVACMGHTSLVYFSRDGTFWTHEWAPWSETGMGLGQDLAYTGDGVAVAWIQYSESLDKQYVMYMLFDMDARVIVPPRRTLQVVEYSHHLSIGSNGSTVLVFSGTIGEAIFYPPPVPGLWLLDLAGDILDGPVILDERGDYHMFWDALGLFWEGDAYAVLWNTWPSEFVLYRRFRVEG